MRARLINASAAKFFQRANAEDVIKEVLEDMEHAIAAVTARPPNGYPEKVAIPIFEGLRRTARMLVESKP